MNPGLLVTNEWSWPAGRLRQNKNNGRDGWIRTSDFVIPNHADFLFPTSRNFMVAPPRVELNPPAFQTGARTRYAREPRNLERSTGFEPVLKEWHSSVLAATLTPQNQNWMGRLESNQRVTGFRAPCLTCLATAQNCGWPPWIRTRHSIFKESRDAASLTANIFKDLAPRAGFEPAMT